MIRKFIKKWEILITLIISVTSIFLATKANEMTRIQTEVVRNSSLPDLQVVEKNENEYDSVIEISNLEGRIDNYNSRIVTFLKCSYVDGKNDFYEEEIRFLYKGIIIKHNKTEPTYTKTSLFLCEKRRFFMARTKKGGKSF